MKKKRLVSLWILLFALFACGGGGTPDPLGTNTGTPGANTNPTGGSNTSPGTNTPPVSLGGFDFSLSQGDYWEYAWVYSSSSTSSSGTSGKGDVGTFRITLGAPVTLGGKTAFPVVITGKRTDPGGTTYLQNLTHVAVDGDQVLVSRDGSTLEVAFDAADGTGRGGFFVSLGLRQAIDVTRVSVNNQFLKNVDAYRVGASNSDPLCDTVLGYTFCGDQSYDIREYEYYKEGIGPLAYSLYSNSTFSGGGFTTIHRTEKTIGLVDSSRSAPDGYTPHSYPWRIRSEMPVASFDPTNVGGVALNGKIYVFDAGAVHIYDPASDSWSTGAPMPGSYSPVAVVQNGLIVVFSKPGIYVYDPLTDSWSTSLSTFDFTGTVAQFASSPLGHYTAFAETGDKRVYFQDMTGIGHVTWLASSYPGSAERSRAMTAYNNELYLFGGVWVTRDVWGWKFYYYGQSYRIDPFQSAPTWQPIAAMPTPRSGAMPVVSGNRIYLFGGTGDAKGDAQIVEVYDPAADTWTRKADAPLRIFSGVACEVNGKIYIVAGQYVLEYDPARD